MRFRLLLLLGLVITAASVGCVVSSDDEYEPRCQGTTYGFCDTGECHADGSGGYACMEKSESYTWIPPDGTDGPEDSASAPNDEEAVPAVPDVAKVPANDPKLGDVKLQNSSAFFSGGSITYIAGTEAQRVEIPRHPASATLTLRHVSQGFELILRNRRGAVVSRFSYQQAEGKPVQSMYLSMPSDKARPFPALYLNGPNITIWPIGHETAGSNP